MRCVDRVALVWWIDDGGWRWEVVGGVLDVGRWGRVQVLVGCVGGRSVGAHVPSTVVRMVGCVCVCVCACVRACVRARVRACVRVCVRRRVRRRGWAAMSNGW